MKVEIDIEGVPSGYEAVAFRVPHNREECISFTGKLDRADAAATQPRLIVRKVPPKLVPLEPADIIVGKTLVRSRYGTALVLTVSSDGVSYAAPCFDSDGTSRTDTNLTPISNAKDVHGDSFIQLVTWARLKKQADYSNDHGATWQPCSKVAP